MSAGSSTREELRSLFLFEALRDEQLDWLVERGEVRTYDAGVVVSREGDPGTHLWVLVDGALRLSRLVNGEDLVVNETSHRGAYGGAVRAYVEPDGVYSGSITTTVPSRFFRLPSADFAELVRTWFPMALHLLDGLYVGIRNSEAQVRQREHLASLGTLSANLAHELNNPAAATVRAAEQLRERVAGMRQKLGAVATMQVDREVIARLVELQERAVERAAGAEVALTPVQRSDAEDELADRLGELGVTGAFDLAPVLVQAGLGDDWVDEVVRAVHPGEPEPALRWLVSTLETEALMDEIEDASSRISQLVAAVKQYSFMDSGGEHEVDLHPGLESTVVMLGGKLGGIEVVRDYETSLPRVPGHPGELNQVWTNLIDNAAHAMAGRGRLVLRTRTDGEDVVVEVVDDGPGIPAEVLPRIWEAFFTTKPPGEGSGLGLDNARRIVERQHRGSIDVDTSPAGTAFRVRLPQVRPA